MASRCAQCQHTEINSVDLQLSHLMRRANYGGRIISFSFFNVCMLCVGRETVEWRRLERRCGKWEIFCKQDLKQNYTKWKWTYREINIWTRPPPSTLRHENWFSSLITPINEIIHCHYAITLRIWKRTAINGHKCLATQAKEENIFQSSSTYGVVRSLFDSSVSTKSDARQIRKHFAYQNIMKVLDTVYCECEYR